MVKKIGSISLIFNDEEWNDFISRNSQISIQYIAFLAKLISSQEDKKDINYSELRDLMIYEKRIKYNVYKFLLFFEEGLTKQIIDRESKTCQNYYMSNQWEDKTDKFETMNNYNEQKFNFGWKLDQLKKMSLINKQQYDDYKKSIRELRNKTMHFNCIYIDLNSIQNWIVELFEYLPENFQKSFKENITKSSKNLKINSKFILQV
ncbi:hypothetical protein [Mesoplasma corruscae]|uniref:Abi-like protein n=1 Tax=Mesoplasma corruscae TaxID=216874 RepID=A0A2S5RHR4_9MOLU|nr:hypothetical protein [Mesoplasma corruscae]PPE06850.1 hypothetical protein MCORR_v1c04810 [Mesoplasma corruscae]